MPWINVGDITYQKIATCPGGHDHAHDDAHALAAKDACRDRRGAGEEASVGDAVENAENGERRKRLRDGPDDEHAKGGQEQRAQKHIDGTKPVAAETADDAADGG